MKVGYLMDIDEGLLLGDCLDAVVLACEDALDDPPPETPLHTILTVSSTLPTLLAMTSAASRPPLPGRHDLVGDAMEAAAVAFGDREAYDDGSRRLTFTRRGDVVAIAPPPLIDYAIAYAAIVRVGAVSRG